jgi:hypothetical protein
VCSYITIGLPISARHLLERAREQQGLLQVSIWDSSPTTKVFGSGYVCATITHGGCSCDLVFRAPVDTDDVLAKQRARLRKKGLSETKIQQALDAKAYALTKPEPSSLARDALAAMLSMLVENTAGVRLFSHFYSGNINTEAVPRPGAATVSVETLKSEGMPEDTLLSVTAVA